MRFFIGSMKKEIRDYASQFAPEIKKVSAFAYLDTNRNSFDTLSATGIICGVFVGILGLLIVLIPTFFGASTRITNIGFILIFFSLVLLMIGTGNRSNIAGDQKTERIRRIR
jgi:uncharacterized membrane protein YuzA (DUF378 family)